ncbi:response regulator [bacterium]|nr:response regulator [bacterium]
MNDPNRKLSNCIYAILAALLLFLNCSGSSTSSDASQIIELNTGWQYRTGDSPIDSTGKFVWLEDSLNSSQWKPFTQPNSLILTGRIKSLWMRTRIPDWRGTGPGLFTGSIKHKMQVFLGDEQIYEFGDFLSQEDNHFQGWRHHLIPLPDHFQNQIVTFRIWSDDKYTGIGSSVRLGSINDITKKLFLGNVDDLVFSTLFIFVGIVLLVLFLFFQKNRLVLGLALFLFTIGIFTGSNALFLQTVINAPYLFFLLDILSLFMAPVGCYIVIGQVIPREYQRTVQRLWQLHLLYATVTSVLLALFRDISLDPLYNSFFILASVSMVISVILILLSIRKGGVEIKLLLAGILLSFFFNMLEIFSYVLGLSHSDMHFRISWIHIGVLCFVVTLVWIVIYRYTETNRQKEAAQADVLESVIQSERMKSEMALKHVEAEKFKDLDRMKSRFFANISHEFRTPLTLILGMAKQLEQQASNETEQSKFGMLIRNGNRLLRLVNQLLDLSRLDGGKLRLQAREWDIVTLIRGICHSFEFYARQHEIDIVLNACQTPALLFFDYDKMEKIVGNLVSNAVKFTPAGGRVEVSVLMNETLDIVVEDTGPGIDSQHLPHIFDRFYQAGNGYVKDQQGSGIGLALAHELVKLHHGDIDVESEMGKGTVFTVRLPLGREHLEEDECEYGVELSTTTPTSVLPQGRKLDSGGLDDSGAHLQKESYEIVPHQGDPSLIPPRGGTKGGVGITTGHPESPILLIVEDNADMRAYIRDMLTGDYQIIEAEDGRIGFDRAAERIPDLIISDVMMPKMDGYELCEKLKNDEHTSHIPVVLLTARSNQESKMEGLTQGADAYLIKPFESAELNVRVKNLIDQCRLLRQRFSKEIYTPLTEIAVTPADEKFLRRAVEIIEDHIKDPDLSIEWFSREMNFSRSQLHRKFQALTGQSASEFIRSVRLKRAVQLLDRKAGTVSEIAFETGFSSPAYFGACFKEQFGYPPSAYHSQSK